MSQSFTGASSLAASALTGTVLASNVVTASLTSVGTLTTLTVSGTATLQALVDISGGSAGQIKFPAAQNASADANTLDDYEEGTFTPTVTDSTANPATYTAREGKYTKIGNVVFYDLVMDIAGIAGMTGGDGARIGGLPFTNRAVPGNYSLGNSVAANGVTFNGFLTGFIPASATFMFMNDTISAAAGGPLTVTNLGTGWFTISGKYYIS